VFNKLRELFINQKVPELTEQPSAEEAELRENITKQQLVVRYLEVRCGVVLLLCTL